MPKLSGGLIDTAAQAETTCDRRIYGVTVGKVISNRDATVLGRVQVQLPWLPGVKPWARLCRPDKGTYFVPQVGDEVLIAFNHGDIREPYVMGSAWNATDRPPTSELDDPVTKRLICTPMGHELEFDDAALSITIKGIAGHMITIGPKQVEIVTVATTGAREPESTTRLTLDAEGKVSIEAAQSIELKARSITLRGSVIEIKSDSSLDLNGGQNCTIQAGRVNIN